MDTPPFRWVRGALARRALAEHMSHYRLAERTVSATDGNITARHPLTYDVPSCLVRGEHIEAANRVLDGAAAPVFTMDADMLLLRGAHSRVRMPTMPIDVWPESQAPDGWEIIPPGLCRLLEDMLPYVAEGADSTAWTSCIGIAGGHLWSTDKNIMARTRRPFPLPETVNVLLPRATIDFVVNNANGLTSWSFIRNESYSETADAATPESNEFTGIAFLWENGAWMRSTLVNGKWPLAQTSRLLNDGTEERADIAITGEWRERINGILNAVGSTGAGIVELRNDVAKAEGAGLFVEVDTVNVLPEGMPETLWPVTSLRRFVDNGKMWGPQHTPAPFVGENIIGVMARGIR